MRGGCLRTCVALMHFQVKWGVQGTLSESGMVGKMQASMDENGFQAPGEYSHCSGRRCSSNFFVVNVSEWRINLTLLYLTSYLLTTAKMPQKVTYFVLHTVHGDCRPVSLFY